MTKAELPPKSSAAKVESVVLRASIHCEGCRRKIKRIIYAVDGVEEVNIEAESGKVTVTGKSLDAKEIVQRLQKSGKQAEIWGGGPAKTPNMNTINPQATNNKQQQVKAATGASFPNNESKEKQHKPGKQQQQQEKSKAPVEHSKDVGGASVKPKELSAGGGGGGAPDFLLDELDDADFDFISPVKPAGKSGGKKGGKRGGNGAGGVGGGAPAMDAADFMNMGAGPVYNNANNNQLPPASAAGIPVQPAGIHFQNNPANNNSNNNFVSNRNMNFPAPDYMTTGYALQQSAEYATHMFSDENANACAIM